MRPAQQLMSYYAQSTDTISFKINDNALVQTTHVTGYNLLTKHKITAILAQFAGNGQLTRGQLTDAEDISGKLHSSNAGDIAFSGKAEYIENAIGNQPQLFRQGFINFQYSTGDLTVGWTEANGERTYYINGVSYKADAFATQFGFDLLED
jgi:hypothetical protein